MKRVPRVLLIGLAALGMAGCRTYGTAPSPRLLPPPAPKAAFDVQDFVSEHNRNAELVESLQAKTQITAKSTKKFSRLSGGAPLAGVMVMERPRNFRLELKADTGMRKDTVADIGSNETEFWFMNQDEKQILTCKYDELPSTPLAASFQPDWIVDALGLKVISPEEARSIKTRPGKEPQTTELIFPPQRANGQSSTRVLTVSNQTRKIKAHRLYAGDGKVLAQAETSEYQDTSVDDPADKGARTEVVCVLPKQIRLEWKQEQFVLDVNLKDVQLNSFDPSQRDLVFVEPDRKDYARVNLARNPPPEALPAGETRIRETMPAPESRGFRFSKPIPESDDASFADDDGGLNASRNRGRSASNVERASATAPLEVPIRARPPVPPNSYDFQVADSLRDDVPPAAMSIER